MIKVDQLSITTIKGRQLVDSLSFIVNDGDKLAIIGEEGNGKSTLIKAIYANQSIREYCKISGNVNTESAFISVLEQKLDAKWDSCTVLEFFLLDKPTSEIDYSRYNLMPLAEIELEKMKFDIQYMHNDMKIHCLSGGEKVKLQLAKILISSPDLIILDEPTNDLDIETIDILESFILNTTKPIIYISHDETLLENTANQILHIEQLIKQSKPKHTLQKCTYAEYVQSRKDRIEHQTQIAYGERRERKKKEEVLNKIRQKVQNTLNACKKDPTTGRTVAKKMANIKAVERRYSNEELTEIPSVEEAINFLADTSVSLPSQKRVLELCLSELRIGNKKLAESIDLTVLGQDKIAIVGKNGCGKSTLLKQMLPKLTNTPNIKVGYFSQNYQDVLDYDNTPVDELTYPNIDYNPRTFLASMKLTKEEVVTKIRHLSEGQKAKIALLKLIIEQNNVIVLDEPTRNLSPLTNPVIRQVMQDYKGCIISVTHDRKFIKEVCNKAYQLSNNGLTVYSVDS